MYMYTYVFTIRRRCRRKEEKDELLAHMQASMRARALCVNVTVKKAITARLKERERESCFLFCLYIHMCVQ
jgi:hypothetical protein